MTLILAGMFIACALAVIWLVELALLVVAPLQRKMADAVQAIFANRLAAQHQAGFQARSTQSNPSTPPKGSFHRNEVVDVDFRELN